MSDRATLIRNLRFCLPPLHFAFLQSVGPSARFTTGHISKAQNS
jgi:hypothetical protein